MAGFEAPFGSDRPDAVRGPWHAVLVADGDDMTVGFDQWIINGHDWAYDGRTFTVAVVRGTAAPMDVNDNGEGTVPNIYQDYDELYRHDGLSGDDAADRWAQARLVVALLNRNTENLDTLAALNAAAR
jgi:hypothetical protein